jgi:two-component system sensor kinase FixL
MAESGISDRGGPAPWAWGLAAVATIVLLGRISDVGSIAGLPIKPWRPSAGFVFGILLAHGLPMLPWTVVGSALSILASAWISGAQIEWAAPILAAFLANAAYAAAALYLRKRAQFDLRLGSVADVLRLLTIGIIAAPVVAALEVAVFTLLGPLDEADLGSAYVRLCVGNLIGVTVIAPIVLRLHNWRQSSLRASGPRGAVEVGLIAVIVMALSWFIFGMEESNEFKLFDLLFLPVVALAVRYGLDGALAGLALAQVTMIGWLDWRDFPGQMIVELQTLMLILSATSLFVGVVVTERERASAELRENERRLRAQDALIARNARLNSIGQMGSILAHELNQPLTAIRAYMRAAARSLSGPSAKLDEASADLERGISQVDLAATIIRRLREFLRRPEQRRSPVAPEKLLRDTMDLVESDANRLGIALQADADADLPPIAVDEVQIKQVLLNLVRNAMDALSDRTGERAIVVRAQRAGIGSGVEIVVRDGGGGISAEIRERLFSAFATTKKHGLGLGLAISRTIVEEHGGRIWLEATGPDGSEFRVFLPAGSGQ